MESDLASSANIDNMTVLLDSEMLDNPRRLGPTTLVIDLRINDQCLTGKAVALTELAAR